MGVAAGGSELRRPVLAALTAELDRRRAEVAAIDPRLVTEVDRLVEFATAGGKFLRSSFLCLGYLAVAPELSPAVIRAAAALELLQACALLHDDLIDRSDTRRGRPSVHRAVAADYAGADHLGVSVALLLGDLALAWADDLFVDAAHSCARLDAVLPDWQAVRTEVLSGQLLDVLVTASPPTDAAVQLADADLINRYKTAAYTVTRPLLLGAELAGADPDVRRSLSDYGQAVGVAFQLRDDLLGVFGDPAVTGKPVAGDLLEGKRTALVAVARQRLSGIALAELDAGLGRPNGDAVRLAELIRDSGAVGQVTATISDLSATALSALSGSLRRPAADALADFARGSSGRNT